MSNKCKEIDIKNCTCYFFDDMINKKSLIQKKINVDGKSYKSILIHYIGYVTVKNLSYVKINSVNPLYLIIDQIDGYIEEYNENKYLTLVPTDKSKELWTKIRDIIRSKTNNSDNCDDKYIKISFDSDNNLPPRKY